MLGIENLKINSEILIGLSRIDEFKGTWNALDAHTSALNMLREVADHGQNLQRVLKPLKAQPLSLEMVRLIHQMQNGHKGSLPDFKAGDNTLTIVNENGGVTGALETAPPEQVEPLLKKLLEWTNEKLERGDLHPLILTAAFTGVFLQLAPFEKGNQKTALFLIVLLLLKSGYAYAPYAPLDKLLAQDSQAYFRALKHLQLTLEAGSPDWSGWLLFFLTLLGAQKAEIEARLFSKSKDLSHLPTLSARILSLFEDHDRLQMKEIIALTRGRRSTIKLRLGEMVEGGYLRRYGQARNTWYALV